MFTLNAVRAVRDDNIIYLMDEQDFAQNVQSERNNISNLLENYLNSIFAVSSYCTAVTLLKEPPFRISRDFITSYREKMVGIKALATYWNDSLLPSLISVPKTIVDYNDDFLHNYNSIVAALKSLVINDNQPDRDKLIGSIDALLTSIENQETLVLGVSDRVDNFRQDIFRDCQSIITILNEAASESTSLSTIVSELTKKSQLLETELESANYWFNVAGITLGVSVSVGFLGVGFIVSGALAAPVAWPLVVVGIVVGGIGGLGVIAATVNMVVARAEVNRLAKEISDTADSIGDTNYDIALLATQVSLLNILLEKNEKAQAALSAIWNVWNQLYKQLKVLRNRLADSRAKISVKEYEEIMVEMELSKNDWENIVAVAETISNITIVDDIDPATITY